MIRSLSALCWGFVLFSIHACKICFGTVAAGEGLMSHVQSTIFRE